jgi:hypothetical protein
MNADHLTRSRAGNKAKNGEIDRGVVSPSVPVALTGCRSPTSHHPHLRDPIPRWDEFGISPEGRPQPPLEARRPVRKGLEMFAREIYSRGNCGDHCWLN